MSKTRVAAIVSHPIQYQAPLFRKLAYVPDISLSVFFEHDHGVKVSHDPEFGKSIRFDVPLTEGYEHRFLTEGKGFGRTYPMLARGIRTLTRELRAGSFDWVWVHGYTNPTTLAAMVAARTLGIKILLRGESTQLYPLPRVKQWLKDGALRAILGQCTAFAYIGEQNRKFYMELGAKPEQLFFAPYSVDNMRFAAEAAVAEDCGKAREIREKFEVEPQRKLCIFVGKLIARKRPLDLVHAIGSLPREYVILFLGDGPLRGEVEDALSRSNVRGHVIGFVNQSELAGYYAAADILVIPSEQETWGLVANEVMACGKPVVASDRVGSAYDLLAGPDNALTGAVYSCGDLAGLGRALQLVSTEISRTPGRVREAVTRKIASYDVGVTATGLVDAFLSKPRR